MKIKSSGESKNEKLYAKRKRLGIKIIFFVICLLMGFEGLTNLVRPTLILLCKVRAESLATTISASAVQEVMGGLGYLDLITLDRDEEGGILALRANVIGMSKISSQISTLIQKKYDELDDMFVKIPIGNFTGNELLAGRGPKIVIKIMPVGTVSTDYKTEFISSGINQTRHRVYLEVKSKMTIVGPFTNRTVEVISNVNVAETVLIGEVPSTFYNLEGVSDLTIDDTMNFWEE